MFRVYSYEWDDHFPSHFLRKGLLSTLLKAIFTLPDDPQAFSILEYSQPYFI